ncbi:MAG: hypothetical protein IJ038_03930 [Clostridia bacterium]|nr:hypothetical protein [Clostridia bacterium]
MKIRLSIFLIITVLCCSLASCVSEPAEASLELSDSEAYSATLSETEDYGQEYIDSLIFIGESTTYHLKSRGVLKDGENTRQVWAPKSGTVNLDMGTKNLKIVYPNTSELLTCAEAAEKAKPEYVIFTFGLNGAVNNVRKGEEYYKSCYRSLINSVREASPDTKIILQSAFPIASNMDMSNYSVDLQTLNEYIDVINLWTLELACEDGLRYLNTAEILKDGQGLLRFELQAGDGHHLTAEAYREILSYIRTHGYV